MVREAAAVLLALLCRCALRDVHPGYQLSPTKPQGLLAVGLTASDDMWNFSWDFRKIGSTDQQCINFYTYVNPLMWQNPRGRLAVVELDEGEYEFIDWGAADNFKPVAYLKIPFTIRPGRVTYLGRLHVELFKDERQFALKASDHLAEDEVALKQLVPALADDQIDRQPLDLRECRDRNCTLKKEEGPLIIPIVIFVP